MKALTFVVLAGLLWVTLPRLAAHAGVLHDASISGDVTALGAALDALRVEPKPGEPVKPAEEIDAYDSSGKTPLLHAVVNDRYDAVAQLLGAGAEPDRAGADQVQPLFLALERKNAQTAKLLLDAGANPNIRGTAVFVRWNAEGNQVAITATEATPLHLAASLDALDIATELVRRGADVNAVDEHGRSGLHHGVVASADLAALLVRAGANVDAKDDAGVTPLIQAVFQNNDGWVRQLVDAGAAINLPDARGRTPAYWAVARSSTALLKVLVEIGADVNLATEDGWTPLRAAIESDRAEPAVALLEAGADPNLIDTQGVGPLHAAIRRNDVEMTKLLLARGADPNLTALGGPAPALLAGDRAMLELLLRKGAKVDVGGGEKDYRMIHTAAAKGDLERLRFLLSKGADVNARNKTGDAPLHLASFNGHVEAVRFLLDNGADFSLVNNKTATPIQIADFGKQPEVVKLLEQYGAVLTPYEVH